VNRRLNYVILLLALLLAWDVATYIDARMLITNG